MSKDWSGNSNIYACNHRSKDEDVAENDFYATHPESIELFLKKCDEVGFELPLRIWEPACGQGHISKVLMKHGHLVLSADLVDRGFGIGGIDFLGLTRENTITYGDCRKCIFTNPPYNKAVEFVEKALELLDDDGICIMFLKTTFLESKARVNLFKKKKLRYVWQYVNRQGCGKNGGEFKNSGAAAYAMFIWDKSYNGLPQLDWIE